MAEHSTLRMLARFALGLFLGSLAIEAGLRLVEASPLWRVLPVMDASLYGPDAATGYAHRPGARGIRTPENRVLVEINSLGLRDRLDRTLSKPAGSRRWAVAGDSIIEAQQVPLEQTFVFLAEDQLSRAMGRKIEVVNLGLAGARPAVIIERLRTRAPALGLDGLAVMISAGEFLSPSPDDPSEYAGYVPGPDGKAVISHAFRDGRGFRMRNGRLGAAIYGAVGHSRLALLLNNRKNTGLWAELAAPAAAAPAHATDPCSSAFLGELETLWGPAPIGFTGQRLAAFIADLAAIARETGVPAVIALRGLAHDCPALEPRFAVLRTAVSARLNAAGLGFADVDRAVRQRVPAGQPLASIYGFGAKLGGGHLNAFGHRVYAEVVGEVIMKPDQRRPP